MRISILTLFPEMFVGPFDHSIIKRAKENGLIEIEFVNIRDFGIGSHKMVDDTPYGGGIGMVMRVDVVHQAIEHTKKNYKSDKTKVIHLTASGNTFSQQKAREFAKLDHVILLCGHYEGFDDRIHYFVDEGISIGDFILTGGEIPAMLVADAVTRLLPGTLPAGATEEESFADHPKDAKQQVLEYPQYTKPPTYKNHSVPEILLSGNHKNIKDWREEQAIKRTKAVRPDLLKKS